MATINTRVRSSDPEIMDDFSLTGEELRDALHKIARINRLLGGNNVTLRGVETLIRGKGKSFTVVDAGCGNGDMLRMLADFGRRNDLEFRLIGVDANEFTIGEAERLSDGYDEITYIKANILTGEGAIPPCDIVICTLTLHHFTDEEILRLMARFSERASLGIVINDLHRSALAYRLFQVVCSVFRLNRMSRSDGLVSILRGFKREDLRRFSKRLGFKKYTIQWRWAFRYRWIIFKV